MDPTLLTGLLGAAEAAINKALAYDPASRQRLLELSRQKESGQTLALHMLTPKLSVYMHLGEQGPTLLQHYEGEVTTSLTGNASDLFQLMLNPPKNLHGSGVTVAGSTAFLAELQAILQNLDIDWEDALSEQIGIVPAHSLAQAFSGASHWAKDRQQSLQRLISEYLTEESGAVIGRNEFTAFSDDIHQLRLSLDRAQARFDALRAALDNATPKDS
ncbi:MAG TPA: hypothetical protein VIC02_05755 [Kineobactrum sp.]